MIVSDSELPTLRRGRDEISSYDENADHNNMLDVFSERAGYGK
jgi:hypothetical protein